MRSIPVCSILFAVAALGVPASISAQETPQIFAGGNGELEVTFSNNCVVYYDANGSRKEANSNCSSSQRRRADDAAESYRREQGGVGNEAPPGGFGSGSSSDVPEIIVGDDGGLQVNVGLPCSVYYSRRGRFDRTTGVCSRDDRRSADRAVEGYLSERGDDHEEASQSGGALYGGVAVYRYKSGSYQATVTGGCTVFFSKRGIALTSTKSCTSVDKARAAVAVIRYKKEHNID